MTTKPLQKAIDLYSKNGDLEPLVRELTKLTLYMMEEAKHGFDTDFLNQLPSIEDNLKCLALAKRNN